MLLRQQHLCLGIVQHQRNPLGRIIGIQRNISSSSFQHCHHGNHHIQATRNADRYPHFGTDAQLGQMMGQLVRALVEFLITQ